jgi:hypothetical protein
MKNIFSTYEWLSLFLLVTLSLISIFPSICHAAYGYIPGFFLAESGLYETVGAVACFVAGLLSLWSFKLALSKRRHLQAFWLLLLSVACLFIAGEEVSWGQHHLGFEPPSSITSNNFQGEFNLHNSKLIQSGNNDLSSIFFKLLMLYFIVIPMFLVVFPTIEKYVKKLMIPIPSMLIAMIALFAKAGDIINHKIIYGPYFERDNLRLGEAVESIMELCLLILSFEVLYYLKNNITNLRDQTQQR